MRKKVFVFALCTVLFALGGSAWAQQPTKVPRIGYLTNTPFADQEPREAFRQGMRDLGYVEGKNIVIEWRFGQEKPDRVSDLAVELARLKVDIIVTGGNSTTETAKKATNTIPIVMTQSSDPVAAGFDRQNGFRVSH